MHQLLPYRLLTHAAARWVRYYVLCAETEAYIDRLAKKIADVKRDAEVQKARTRAVEEARAKVGTARLCGRCWA